MMGTLPIDRLVKLIPMLSSEHDGEVVSAARAIDRALKGAQCDWHDLVKAIGSPVTVIGMATTPEQQAQRYYDMAERMRADRNMEQARRNAAMREAMEEMARRAEAKERRAQQTTRDGAEVRRLADQLLGGGKLRANEATFVNSMHARAKRFADFEMTEKQRLWWNVIVEKAIG